ncbi:MAG: YkgJ family cysteine cluster protein [Hyphomicrobiaceae bacterium]
MTTDRHGNGGAATVDSGPCRTCGACCAHAPDWPRFTLESEDEIARIPAALIAADGSGMRCEGERCTALAGTIGAETSCTIYAVRPIVCRDCLPGDDACTMARTARGLPALRG